MLEDIWESYRGTLRKYVKFSGRATRKEYWSFVAVNALIVLVLNFSARFSPIGFLFTVCAWVYALGVFYPSLAVSVRRLHDIGRSGLWLFINLVPFIGSVVTFIFFILEGTPGANAYGPDPRANTP
ncbi:MAG: DUF805 domain-containing protein [Patescibacteria group bacterium]|nr:DUF805 domain-containing protein [Patescibacteria group bacterium]